MTIQLNDVNEWKRILWTYSRSTNSANRKIFFFVKIEWSLLTVRLGRSVSTAAWASSPVYTQDKVWYNLGLKFVWNSSAFVNTFDFEGNRCKGVEWGGGGTGSFEKPTRKDQPFTTTKLRSKFLATDAANQTAAQIKIQRKILSVLQLFGIRTTSCAFTMLK